MKKKIIDICNKLSTKIFRIGLFCMRGKERDDWEKQYEERIKKSKKAISLEEENLALKRKLVKIYKLLEQNNIKQAKQLIKTCNYLNFKNE